MLVVSHPTAIISSHSPHHQLGAVLTPHTKAADGEAVWVSKAIQLLLQENIQPP